jgi:predicted dehydrogenase
MIGKNFSRRNLISSSIGGAVAAGISAPMFIPAKVFGEDGAPSANNKINIGMIGLGLISKGHFSYFLNKPLCEVVALCDVDQLKLKGPMDQVQKANKKCDTYEHYEELIDRSDIDAVVICTPDHWHVSIAIDAMRKGKDVYVEKPISLTVEEGIAIRAAEKKYGRIVQNGSMQRSSSEFHQAASLVRNGYIGDLIEIEAKLGTFPPAQQFPEEEIPSTLNYDKWLGPAPWEPYNKERMKGNYGGGWRCYWDYGSRKNGDWGAHHFDIIQWALGMDDSGPTLFMPKGYEGEKYQYHQYANGLKVFRDKKDYSEGQMIAFKGSKGIVYVSRGKINSTPVGLKTLALPNDGEALYKSTDHRMNWLEGIINRKTTICPASVGHRTATICQLSGIAEQLGRPIRWDPLKEQIVGDEKASLWLSRPRRAPYALNL